MIIVAEPFLTTLAAPLFVPLMLVATGLLMFTALHGRRW